MSIGMSDEFQSFDQRAVIKVCGIGGGGGNAIVRMIEEELSGVDFISINTDAQALKGSSAPVRLQIGVDLTGGLGSGAKPEMGQQAAEEDRERIREVLSGADMVFLTAGLGGGTGTGASPIVAQEAAECGALTVAIVTLPFSFEGPERMKNAIQGLTALEKHVDTLIVVPNDRVAELSQTNTSFLDAFRKADEVLHNGVRAISELITVPGLINLDFADVRTIMQARGRALMGIGVAEGENRAENAAAEAIVCPLLEQSNINGARGVIVNIKGGCDIGMREVQDAVTTVKKSAHPEANIIFGAVIDEEERPELKVTVIAAGFPKEVSHYIPIPDFDAPAKTPSRKAEIRPAPEPVPAAAIPEAEDNGFLFKDDTDDNGKMPDPDEDFFTPPSIRRQREQIRSREKKRESQERGVPNFLRQRNRSDQ
jgi:cell division protein FtsZ